MVDADRAPARTAVLALAPVHATLAGDATVRRAVRTSALAGGEGHHDPARDRAVARSGGPGNVFQLAPDAAGTNRSTNSPGYADRSRCGSTSARGVGERSAVLAAKPPDVGQCGDLDG